MNDLDSRSHSRTLAGIPTDPRLGGAIPAEHPATRPTRSARGLGAPAKSSTQRSALLVVGALLTLVLTVRCGSGGGGQAGVTPPAVPGIELMSVGVHVDLPVGHPGSSGLEVSTLVGRAPLDGAASASLKVLSGGPMMAFVRNAAGSLVLTGWIDAAQGWTTLSPRTTADTMLFYERAAFLLDETQQSEVIRAIALAPEVEPLAQILAAELGSAPFILGSESLERRAALAAAQAAMFTKPPPIYVAGMLRDTSKKSGISVDQAGLDAVVVKNSYRRRAFVFVDRISYTAESGGETSSFAHMTSFPLAAVSGASSFLGALSGLITGSTPYTPVLSEPATLAVAPATARRTTYHVVALGSGVRAGDEANLDDLQRSRLDQVQIETLLFDYAIPFLASITVPRVAEAAEALERRAGAGGAVKSLYSTLTTLVPTLATKSQAGDYAGCCADLLTALTSDSTVRSALFEFVFENFLRDYSTAGGLARTGMLEQMGAGVDDFFAHISAIDKVLGAVDTIVKVTQILTSARVETFEVKVDRSPVRLDPERSDIAPYGVVTLKASIPDLADVPADLTYHWKVDGTTGTLYDNTGAQHSTDGSDDGFDGTLDTVAWSNSKGTEGRVVVQVEVFHLVGGQKVSIGVADALIEVRSSRPTILPRKISLSPGQSAGLRCSFDPALPAGGPAPDLYRWTTPGSHGRFENGTTATETTSNRAQYRADSGTDDGTETVSVEVFATVDGVSKSLGTAKATAVIEARKSIVMGSGRGDGYATIKDGWRQSCSGFSVYTPKLDNVKRYDVYCYGFNDTAYYGRSVGYSIDPQAPGNTTDKGSEYERGLTGGCGWGPYGGTQAESDAQLQSDIDGQTNSWRFAGMVVEVTVVYKN